MNVTRILTIAAVATLALAGAAPAVCERGFSLQVLLDGTPRPEYHARGAVYIEAVRGRDYVLRITNPLPVRVAVALAVDGLNSIDARHGEARSAAKWVLDPYETIEISGWQTTGNEARRFYFTGERSSYGAWLGQTDNLGVIEAVFYREKPLPVIARPVAVPPRSQEKSDAPGEPPAPAPGSTAESMGAAGTMQAPSVQRQLRDDYAATGIGERTRHEVEWVNLVLEDKPAAKVRIRYEFHEQLARMGVLPPASDPFERREAARGFSGPYCPDPSGHQQ